MLPQYECGQCEADVTTAVKRACKKKPDIVPTMAPTGTERLSAERVVTVTCPNGHTCHFPCPAPHE